MPQDFLRPTRVPAMNEIGKRREENGQFRNSPLYTRLGGFSSAAKGRWDSNKMTLERGGPSALRGRPISK
jgi:hypothetical protein